MRSISRIGFMGARVYTTSLSPNAMLMSHDAGVRKALLIACLLAALAAATGCDRTAPPEIVREPTGRSVMLFGMDGLDWRVATPLLEAGEMPNLARLIERGASGKLETILPTHSPIIWTSVVTGREMQDHGILSFWRRVPRETPDATDAEERAIEQLRALGYVDGGGHQMML